MKPRRIIRISLIPLIIFIAVFVIPNFNLQLDISYLLTTVIFLFTIIIGFFIASATANYLNLQSLITQEDSALIGIFNSGRLIQPSKRKALAEAIDQYLIACLEFDFANYVRGTHNEYTKLLGVVDSIKPTNAIALSIFQNLHNHTQAVTQTRQAALLAARRVVKSIHWFILILLTLTIFVFLFVLRDQSILSNLLIGTLATTTYLLLVLLYEIDANVFLEDIMSYLAVQEVFKAIGKPAYYPEYFIQKSNFKHQDKSYRVGFHDSSGQLKIKLIR
jgi:hypothetical protein